MAVPTASILVVLAARGRQLAIRLDLQRTPTISVLSTKEGTATRFSFDTTTVPNAQYDLGLNLVDAHGGVIGAIHPAGEVDHDQVVTVANSVRTPTLMETVTPRFDPWLKEK